MKADNFALRVVCFKEGDYWIAQGLEYDIVAQSKEFDNLEEAFSLTLFLHITARRMNDQELFEGVPKAPEKYWKIFDEAEGKSDKNKLPPLYVPVFNTNSNKNTQNKNSIPAIDEIRVA